jgi:hypothetical protein
MFGSGAVTIGRDGGTKPREIDLLIVIKAAVCCDRIVTASDKSHDAEETSSGVRTRISSDGGTARVPPYPRDPA